MSDTVLVALVTTTGTLLVAGLGGLWTVARYFLDQHRQTEDQARQTIAAKDHEIAELRAEVRELERELWRPSRR